MAIIGLRHGLQHEAFPGWLKFYTALTTVMGVYFVVRWIYRALTRQLPRNVSLIESRRVNVQDQFPESLYQGFKGRIFSIMPFNQSTQLSIDNWEFAFPNLPKQLDGFRICQLSDLHFTGVIKRGYFEYVTQKVQEFAPDILLLTGDIMDEENCLDWIDHLLEKLTATHGKFYILGNHDLLIPDQNDLRNRMSKAGWIQASQGSWHQIQIDDCKILLAGNELPWYSGAEDVPVVDHESDDVFSIALSHSPDQIGWAVMRNVDLLFAGHTHGGQVRLPIVGPIIAPSR